MKKDKTQLLALEDLDGQSEQDILLYVEKYYKATPEQLKGVRLLIAYQSEGNWGCDSSSFFLFKKGKELFEVRGSHCSCYGFEDQWQPSPVTKEDLKLDSFYLNCGGDDYNKAANEAAVRNYIQNL